MEARSQEPGGAVEATGALPIRTGMQDRARRLGARLSWIQEGRLLGEWQRRELRVARSFTECQGLSREQLEDLYQETTIALLERPYLNEEHLRRALRRGIKQRALNLHRDESTHARIHASYARSLERYAIEHRDQHEPEHQTLLKQDALVVKEFLAELTAEEQPVFWAMVEGMRYRAIATALGRPENEARSTMGACERKRERFQRLYNTGRLCGYRASTILALQEGTHTSEELASRAIAHVERCTWCQREHHTNSRKLRRAFEEQACAFLPVPVLLAHASWLTRLLLRSRAPLTALREPAGLLTRSATVAPVAARTAAVVALAAGAAGATHTLTQPHSAPPRQRVATQPTPRAVRPPIVLARQIAPRPHLAVSERPPLTPGHVVEHRPAERSPEGTVEPGFAYLGVRAPRPRRAPSPSPEDQRGGGPFGP